MLKAILGQVFATLAANKLRSFLTMFGVAWGILSIILLTAIGEGFRVSQERNARALGKDIMIIWGGRTSLQTASSQAGRYIRLRYADVQALDRQASLLRMVSPELRRGDLVAKTPLNYGSFDTAGVEPQYQYMRTIEVHWGRPLNVADNREARAVCILGSEVNDQLFGDNTRSVGRTLTLDDHPFTVIGVMPYKSQNSTYSGQDRRKIFIPYRTMVKLFSHPRLGHSRDLLSDIIAMPVSRQVNEEAERQVRAVLARHKGFDATDKDAVWIWNTAQGAALVDSILRSMQWFLGTVGVVTLILGAVGVINIMLVSVRERTVEIGVRMSLGARRRDILLQFFAEASALSFFAGFLGLGIGWGLCQLINLAPMPQDVFAGMIVSPEVGLVSFGVLAATGLASGIYPAWTAASLDPIEALRFE